MAAFLSDLSSLRIDTCIILIPVQLSPQKHFFITRLQYRGTVSVVLCPIRCGNIRSSIGEIQHHTNLFLLQCLALQRKGQDVSPFIVTGGPHSAGIVPYLEFTVQNPFIQNQFLPHPGDIFCRNALLFPLQADPYQIQSVGIFPQPVIDIFIAHLFILRIF